jgi:two-component system chemotaxis response regulator CheY
MARTLLVVDDAIVIRELIKDIASTAGWKVVGEGANGQQAMERFEQLQPDAVTLDLVMPEYDGLHGLRGIKHRDPNAKVLIVSALDQKSVLKDAIRSGAYDFLVKPFDREALINTLDQMVPQEIAG